MVCLKRSCASMVLLSAAMMGLACKSSTGNAPALHASKSMDPTGKWVALFDGTTTNGWHTFKKSSAVNWAVVDGALTRTSDGGDLVTDKTYDNFILEMDWKNTPGGNSGVILHTDETDTTTHWAGLEVQI